MNDARSIYLPISCCASSYSAKLSMGNVERISSRFPSKTPAWSFFLTSGKFLILDWSRLNSSCFSFRFFDGILQTAIGEVRLWDINCATESSSWIFDAFWFFVLLCTPRNKNVYLLIIRCVKTLINQTCFVHRSLIRRSSRKTKQQIQNAGTTVEDCSIQ